MAGQSRSSLGPPCAVHSAHALTAAAAAAAAALSGTARPPAADCGRLLELHREGYEIGALSLSGGSLLNLGKAAIAAEVAGARAALAACGVPATDIVGMRAPGLESKPEVRQALSEAAFLYDRCVMRRVVVRAAT